MRTQLFEQSMEAILLYCKLAPDCIIIAEINDQITRDEFIADFSEHYSVCITSLDLLSESAEKKKIFHGVPNNEVIILDELFSASNDSIAVNLNYNRDWLLSLYRKIIIILPTVKVNQVIQYSNNFWSCVSLHRSFYSNYPCLFTPHFIDEVTNNFESQDDIIRKREIQRTVYTTNNSVRGIILRYFGIELRQVSERMLGNILEKHILAINTNNEFEIINAFDFIFSLGQEFYFNGHYKYALRCFNFLKRKFNLGSNFSGLRDRLDEALAEVCFRLNNYKLSIHYYHNLRKRNTENDETTEQSARIWNNLAVNFYLLGQNDISLSCYHEAYKIAIQLSGSFLFCEILYNMSIHSYSAGRYNQALTYINTCIEVADSIPSRHFSILTAVFKVFRAYTLTTVGDILTAANNLEENLEILRKELFEQNLYVLEAHYAFAFAFLRINNLERALHCATNAHNISRHIRCDGKIKVLIHELLGEINYYQKSKSQLIVYYFDFVLRNNKKYNFFSDDFISWIYAIVDECSSPSPSQP